jgi:hypothetical protein
MTKRELKEWCEQVGAWGPVRDPEELAEALLVLSRQDREAVLAELLDELEGEVRAAIAQRESEPEPARPPARRVRRLRRSASAEEMVERDPVPWKRCTQCGFYGTEIILSGAVPADPMRTCPNCGAPLRDAQPGEIVASLPPERREALLEALANLVVQHVRRSGRLDGTE